ncbi:hypothetical protein [Corynebacterium alimapuense]|uniref:Uncharacterized protein n=1 Tax=Corynebacterium alimapuense TaxID=1576874 RepID=A0A3M8K6X0_9CORY|nr:hypothetical protein [Corynebacterium alimapuense]RNE48312.1 hypothetical protein C5L39_07260 [Corynebacterium alimapuense]
MRRTIVALATSTALIFGAIPAANAAEDLPDALTTGSTGFELIVNNLSSDPFGPEVLEGSSLLLRDWLVGFVGITVVGSSLAAISSSNY